MVRYSIIEVTDIIIIIKIAELVLYKWLWNNGTSLSHWLHED